MKQILRRVTCIVFIVAMLVPSALFASGSTEDESRTYHNFRRGRMKDNFSKNSDGFRGFFNSHGSAVVLDVVEDSPAQRAGLLAGDVILALNGVQSFDLVENIQALQPGETIQLTIAREPAEGDSRILPYEEELSITLGSTDEGLAYAGIQFWPGRGARFNHFRNLDVDTLNQLKQLQEEAENLLKEESLENSSL